MVSFEEVKEKLLRALEDEGVEPPVWLDAMVETILDVIERYGGDVDCEVKRAVWALKEVRSEVETLQAETRGD